jgi:hypothetical protein
MELDLGFESDLDFNFDSGVGFPDHSFDLSLDTSSVRSPGGWVRSIKSGRKKTVGPSRVDFRELKNSELWTQYEIIRYTTQHETETGVRA